MWKQPLSILAVTSSRADWGLLAPVLRLIRSEPDWDLKLCVTGQHLDPAAGGAASLAEITADGFGIDGVIDMRIRDDSAGAILRSLGLELDGFANLYGRLSPRLLLVVGDRYEILAAVFAATVSRVPVAHLCGGDLTEGAFDDAMRHAITKLSHLHFASNEDSARRIRQMGEEPHRVYNVGSPGLDRIRAIEPLPRDALFDQIGLLPRVRNALITFHPITLPADNGDACAEMLAALGSLGADFGLIFTGVNADPGAVKVAAQIEAFVATHDNAVLIPTLGSRLYFSALSHVDVVIGNSSSGLYEAPSFKRATIDIGDRQRGRMRAPSVINCPAQRDRIGDAIRRGLEMDCSQVVNPYGDGYAAERICGVLKQIRDPATLLVKRFHEVPQCAR